MGQLQNVTPELMSRMIQVMIKDAGIILGRARSDFQVGLTEGKSVDVPGIGNLTVKTDTSSITYQDPPNFDQKIVIDQDKYFAVDMKDKNAAQSMVKLTPYLQEGANALANDIDVQLAEIAAAALKAIGSDSTVIGASEFMRFISEAYAYIRTNSVDSEMVNIDMFLGPYTAQVARQLIINKSTDNTRTLMNGYIGELGGFNIFETSSVKNSGTYAESGSTLVEHNFACVSNNALAAVIQKDMEAEIIRREGAFANGLRGNILYGRKVINEKKIVSLVCKPDLSD